MVRPGRYRRGQVTQLMAAPGRSVAQHGSDLAQVHHEGALRNCHSLVRGNAGENAVCETNSCLCCRYI